MSDDRFVRVGVARKCRANNSVVRCNNECDECEYDVIMNRLFVEAQEGRKEFLYRDRLILRFQAVIISKFNFGQRVSTIS